MGEREEGLEMGGGGSTSHTAEVCRFGKRRMGRDNGQDLGAGGSETVVCWLKLNQLFEKKCVYVNTRKYIHTNAYMYICITRTCT